MGKWGWRRRLPLPHQLPRPRHHGGVCGSERPSSHLKVSIFHRRPPHHASAEWHGGAGEPRRCHPPPRRSRGGGRGRLHAAGGRTKPRTRSLLPTVAEADTFPCAQPNHPGQSEGLLRLQGEFFYYYYYSAELFAGEWAASLLWVVIPARYHRAGCERHQDRGSVLRGWGGAECLAAGRVSDQIFTATRQKRWLCWRHRHDGRHGSKLSACLFLQSGSLEQWEGETRAYHWQVINSVDSCLGVRYNSILSLYNLTCRAGRCWCASTTSSTCCVSRSSGSRSMPWTPSRWASLSSHPNPWTSKIHIVLSAFRKVVLNMF